MSLLRKLVLALAFAALLVVAIAVGWSLYRQWSRPDIAKAGGTVLVYEVDQEQSPGDFTPEDLAAALRRRLDPAETAGIMVRPLPEWRVEISVPRRGGDHAEEVEEVKDLIALNGVLEFRILANTDDDKEAIDTAKVYFDALPNNPAELGKLKAAAAAGKSPPTPRPPDGKAFHTPLGDHAYSWVELGSAERYYLGLDNSGPNAGASEGLRKQLEAARKDNKLIEYGRADGAYCTNLFYSREVTNPDRLPARDRDKKYAYFLLTRQEEKSKAVTGALIKSASLGDDGRGQPAVDLRFDGEGTTRLTDLTRKNTGRQLSIILDDVIQTSPRIQSPITGGRAVITGNFSKEEVDRMVSVLRSGALPATLKPQPVSETTVEPRK